MNNSPQKSRRPLWPILIIGLLGLHVGGMAVAVTIALRDRSFLVVPNYYDKAEHWDQARAEKRAAEKLGWRIRVESSPRIDERGRRAASFVLTDSTGQAVKNASLLVEYFHHAHPDRQESVRLSPDTDDPRCFTAMMPLRYPGTWEFHFTATAGDQTYVTTQQEYLATSHDASGQTR